MSERKYHVQAAYPMDLDAMESTDAVLNLTAGREADYSGAGASWAGGTSIECGYRYMGWLVDTFADAYAMHARLSRADIESLHVRIQPERKD